MANLLICPYCRYPIKHGSRIRRCSRCGTYHHAECWRENGGCTTYGCSRAPGRASQELPICPHCGERNNPSDRICWACNGDLRQPLVPERTPEHERSPLPADTPNEPSAPIPDNELALRREALEALMAVKSATEVGISYNDYQDQIIAAKQTVDRVATRACSDEKSLFWLLTQQTLLIYISCRDVWATKFSRENRYSSDTLPTTINIQSALGQLLLQNHPQLSEFVHKGLLFGSSLLTDDVMQVLWAEASETIAQCRSNIQR